MKFTEQFALSDLDSNAISSLTSEYLFDREHGKGFNRMQVADARLNGDSLYIHYKSEPTYSSESVAIGLDGRKRSSNVYDTVFAFQAAVDHIGDIEAFAQMSQPEQLSFIRDYINKGLAKVWCSCPAFYYQAHWENMSSHGSTVFPFPGPKGTGVWNQKHAHGLTQPGISICKHIAACIHHIDKDVPTMVSKLLQNLQK